MRGRLANTQRTHLTFTTLILLAILALLFQGVAGQQRRQQEEGQELSDLRTFEIIDRADIETLVSDAQEGAPELSLGFVALGKEFNLRLRESRLFTADAETIWHGPNGLQVSVTPNDIFMEGELLDQPESSARLQLRGERIEGIIFGEDDIYFMERASKYLPRARETESVFYSLSSAPNFWEQHDCGVEHENGVPVLDHLLENIRSLSKPPVDIPWNRALGSMLEIELRVVVDSYYYFRHGANAASRAHTVIHQVSGLFERTMGVTFKIAGTRVALHQSEDAFGPTTDPYRLLDEFAQSYPLQGADLAHLFTGRDLSGYWVGMSWTGALCNQPYGVGLTQDMSLSQKRFVLTAHELGHSVGASHDGTGLCRNTPQGHVMWPVIGQYSTTFSSCSVATIEKALGRASCLTPLSPKPLPAPSPVAPGNSVRNTDLSFRWQETPGADGYYIEILDENAADIVLAETVKETRLEPRVSLRLGQPYSWRIGAIDKAGLGNRTPWQRFSLFESNWHNRPR
jgi:hypothetical protein